MIFIFLNVCFCPDLTLTLTCCFIFSSSQPIKAVLLVYMVFFPQNFFSSQTQNTTVSTFKVTRAPTDIQIVSGSQVLVWKQSQS